MKNFLILSFSLLILIAMKSCTPERRDAGDGEIVETYPDFEEERAELAEEIAFGITEINNTMELYQEQLPASPDETQEKYRNLIDEFQQLEEEMKDLLDEVKQAEESEWPQVKEKVQSMANQLEEYDLGFISDLQNELNDTKK